jgi:hypothetical protein
MTAAAATFAAAPLALAQTPPPAAVVPEHWGFIVAISGVGVLFVLGIIAIASFAENRRSRAKLELVERLLTSGQPVPRELMTNVPRLLPLPEQRRYDIRRAVAFLSWGIGIGVAFYFLSGGNPRAAAWGLLFVVPGLGNLLKAWLTAREIARGPTDGTR